MNDEKKIKTTLLFRRLIFTFQTAAIQQMGKIADPFTGKITRDLEQASLSIDTLDMLQEKCKGNLSEDEAAFLEHVISELKLNYIDEVGRSEKNQEENEDKASEEDIDAGLNSDEPEKKETD